MTRKDYELLARWLGETLGTRVDVWQSLTQRLEQANPNFKRQRFLNACSKHAGEQLAKELVQ